MSEIFEESNEEVLQYVGFTFIRIPRKIATLMFSRNQQERYLHRLYVALVVLSFHSNGSLKKGKKSVPCKAGELITSYRDLAQRTDIHRSTISNLMADLIEYKLIKIEPQKKSYRIRVLGYKEITAMRYQGGKVKKVPDADSSTKQSAPMQTPSDDALNLINSLKNF